MTFKVKARAKEFLFDTIEAARSCRDRLLDMGYQEIAIIVQEEDITHEHLTPKRNERASRDSVPPNRKN